MVHGTYNSFKALKTYGIDLVPKIQGFWNVLRLQFINQYLL